MALGGAPGSGGSVLFGPPGRWRLARLASWKSRRGDLAGLRGDIGAQVSYHVRALHHLGGIADVVADEEDRESARAAR